MHVGANLKYCDKARQSHNKMAALLLPISFHHLEKVILQTVSSHCCILLKTYFYYQVELCIYWSLSAVLSDPGDQEILQKQVLLFRCYTFLLQCFDLLYNTRSQSCAENSTEKGKGSQEKKICQKQIVLQHGNTLGFTCHSIEAIPINSCVSFSIFVITL